MKFELNNSKVSFGLLDVGLGIWDIVDGVKAIKEGNAQAKAFRKAGRKINGAKSDLGKVLNVIKKRCDSNNKKVGIFGQLTLLDIFEIFLFRSNVN